MQIQRLQNKKFVIISFVHVLQSIGTKRQNKRKCARQIAFNNNNKLYQFMHEKAQIQIFKYNYYYWDTREHDSEYYFFHMLMDQMAIFSKTHFNLLFLYQ